MVKKINSGLFKTEIKSLLELDYNYLLMRLGGAPSKIKMSRRMPCCWCSFCKDKIPKETQCLVMYKSGWNAWKPTRINICVLCIKDVSKQIRPKALRKAKERRLLNKI
jgi:hypothetical protein